MELYFINNIAKYLEDDIIGIDYTLFGDIICIVVVCTFLLDLVGDVKTTQLLVRIHTDSNKPMYACLQRENPFGPFVAIYLTSLQKYIRWIYG